MKIEKEIKGKKNIKKTGLMQQRAERGKETSKSTVHRMYKIEINSNVSTIRVNVNGTKLTN